jgi:hypothetical protein
MKRTVSLFLMIMMIITLSTLLRADDQEVRKGDRPFIDIYRVPDEAMIGGKILLKFHSQLTSHLDSHELSRDGEGIVLFGIEELDELNRKFGIFAAKKNFDTPALKNGFEWRHRQWGFHLWYELYFTSQEDLRDIVMAYRELKEIISWAEPEYRIEQVSDSFAAPEEDEDNLRWTPNDPRLTDQWHYHNTGQQNGTPGADIMLLSAWDLEKGHSDVIVAVIDGGIDHNHSDLTGNMWSDIGYNFVYDSPAIEPHNHGTHVAGTVAAVSNNGIGVAGVAGGNGIGNGVRLMSCQVFAASDQGGFHLAPVYAADNGAAVSQNSWSYTTEGDYNQNVLDAIDYFNLHGGGDVMNGGITIFAAGNRGTSGQYYPGVYPGTFSVAGTNNNDQKAWYSSYDYWVDISAPGGETNTVTARGVLSTRNNNTYGYAQGTSMACPHTSGVAGLMLSYAYRNGTILDNDSVADILRNTTDNHYAVNPGYFGMLGTGRLNAYSALLEVQESYLIVLEPAQITATAAGLHEINVSWELNANGNDVMLLWSPDGVFGEPVDGIQYSIGGIVSGGGQVLYTGSETSFLHSGLDEATIYHYKAFSCDADFDYSIGIATETATDYTYFALPFSENFDYADRLPYFWEIADHLNNGLIWQFGTIPDGLTGTEGNYAYLNSNDYGIGLSQNTDLISPRLDLSEYTQVTVSFTHYFMQTEFVSIAVFLYSLDDGENWTISNTWIEETANPAYYSQVIPEAAGETDVRFKWNFVGSNGWYWCVDDIEITGLTYELESPAELTAVAGSDVINLYWEAPAEVDPAGYKVYRDGVAINPQQITETHYTDNDVMPEVTYLYFVTAVYPGGESEPSNTVETGLVNLYPPHDLVVVPDGANVYLSWQAPDNTSAGTGSEPGEVYRSGVRDTSTRSLIGYNIYRNSEIINSEPVELTEYIDHDLPYGIYLYSVTALYAAGESEPTDEVEIEITLNTGEDAQSAPVTRLSGNYPNPFNPSTTLRFSLKEAGEVTLEIFNVKGQRVTTLLDEYREAGSHRVIWNGKGEQEEELPGGIYFYRLEMGEYRAVRKMLYLK